MKTNLIESLQKLDIKLESKGFPRVSPWWLETLSHFWRSKKPQIVIRAGRRGGKSSTLARVAVIEALYGGHKVPPGDRGVIAFISVNRDEATSRLRTIDAILTAIGEPHEWNKSTGEIELLRRPFVFKVLTCSVTGVSGATIVAAICDEVAKWKSDDESKNPADEVIASLKPAMATISDARIYLSSSPLGTEDYHAQAFDAGNTEFQMVAHAESWVSNPTLTEARCRALEPDERLFDREYRAIPSAGTSAIFRLDWIQRAMDEDVAFQSVGAPTMVIDPSSGRNDAFAWTVAAVALPEEQPRFVFDDAVNPKGEVIVQGGVLRLDERGQPIIDPSWQPPRPVIRVQELDSFRGKFSEFMSAESVVQHLARVAKRHRITRVFGDQREAYALQSLFVKHGIAYEPIAWTNSNKADAVTRLRRWLMDGLINLPNDIELRRELLNFAEKITASGNFTYGARTGHDDKVACLLTLAMVELNNRLDKSPFRRNYRTWGESPGLID